jgi:ligand-binding SRPBCC domain-containing protein
MGGVRAVLAVAASASQSASEEEELHLLHGGGLRLPDGLRPHQRRQRLGAVARHEQSGEILTKAPPLGVMSGLMRLGDTVTWEAVHFGVRQRLTSQITAYERPHRFTDEMTQGSFRELRHVHDFVPWPPGTLMLDHFAFRAPLGLLGWVVERVVLTRYMEGLLITRNRYLRQMAETGGDPALLPPTCS